MSQLPSNDHDPLIALGYERTSAALHTYLARARGVPSDSRVQMIAPPSTLFPMLDWFADIWPEEDIPSALAEFGSANLPHLERRWHMLLTRQDREVLHQSFGGPLSEPVPIRVRL